jgi:hypothetical protein
LTKNLCCGLVLPRNLYKNPFTAKKPCNKQGLPVEKKPLLTIAFISVLLLLAVAGIQLANLGRANQYTYNRVEEGEVAPPAGTLPPTILILSPKNNTAYASNNVSFGISERYIIEQAGNS